MHDERMLEALRAAAEHGGGTDETWHVPLDESTVTLGRPGLWDGLTIAHWGHDG